MVVDWSLLMIVEDSFRLRGRGLVLAPVLPFDRFPRGEVLQVQIVEPQGTTRVAEGRFLTEHAILTGGGSKWYGLLVLDEKDAPVPAGSEIRVAIAAVPQPKSGS